MCIGNVLSVIALLFGLIVSVHAGEAKQRIEFWQNNYQALTVASDPRAARAVEIFKRVLRVSGARRGVIPKLWVIKDKRLRVAALPDGWIVLSSGALEQCYRDEQHGDDRLAFVLAHEIAHHLKDDFWHMRFFEAVSAQEQSSDVQTEALHSVRAIAESRDQILAKELEADEHAIVYATMAGFDPHVIVAEDTKVNFFAEWVAALDPGRVSQTPEKNRTHPTPVQRAATVRAKLSAVIAQVEAFSLGLLLYESGYYEQSLAAYRKFLTYFPSREVYHNLAVVHHQIALDAYTQWKGQEPFVIPMMADPDTRARDLTQRGGEAREQLFRQHIEQAISLYRVAIEQDPSYERAYIGLAGALTMTNQPYEAIALLQRAIRYQNDRAAIDNALGVAFSLAGDSERARQYFISALEKDPAYDAARFNLGQLASVQGNSKLALEHWRAYLSQFPSGRWAQRVRKTVGGTEKSAGSALREPVVQSEWLSGVAPGHYVDEIPSEWGTSKVFEVPIGESSYYVRRYPNGVSAVSYEEELLLLSVSQQYAGETTKGIKVGNTIELLLSGYGQPAGRPMIGSYEVWMYPERGISFRVRDGLIKSWVLFLS